MKVVTKAGVKESACTSMSISTTTMIRYEKDRNLKKFYTVVFFLHDLLEVKTLV